MTTQNPIVQQFKDKLAEKQRRFDEKMHQLNENLKNGTAGVKEKRGQWYIEVGQDSTYNEVFGTGIKNVKQPG